MNDSAWWPLKWDERHYCAGYKNIHVFDNTRFRAMRPYHIVVENVKKPNTSIKVDDELSLRCVLMELLSEPSSPPTKED
jgi:hypothetical protein